MALQMSDDLAHEAVTALREHGSQQKAAAALGLARSAYQNRLKRAAERGLMGPVEAKPGFAIKQYSERGPDGSWVNFRKESGEAFTLPTGHAIKGISALVDGEGRVAQQWIKTRADEVDPLAVADALIAKFDGMSFAVPEVAAPASTVADCLALYPLPDLHVGLYAYGAEAGENWDLKKSDRIYRAAFSSLLAMTPDCASAVILGGGDALHADSSLNRTTSGNALDVDGRYEKVLETACELFLDAVTAALKKHDHVTVRVLKGNHDVHATAAIVYFLKAALRNNPRVTVDTSPSLFWVYQFGKVMLAATHGHEARPEQLPGIMAHRWPQMWGETAFRYALSFHVHHRSKRKPVDTIGGVVVETFESPAPQDAWHYGQGFLSGRSLKSTVYHRSLGEIGSSVWPIIPEIREAA